MFYFFSFPAWCIIQVGKVLGVEFELQGIENIDREKGGIVLINHQSALDLIGEFFGEFPKLLRLTIQNIFFNFWLKFENFFHASPSTTNVEFLMTFSVLAKLWPVIGRATQVAKKEILYLFPFGFAAWLWGTLFINRQNHTAATNTINSESKAINEKKVRKILLSHCVVSRFSISFSVQNNVLPRGH